jgi:hypothetical protein
MRAFAVVALTLALAPTPVAAADDDDTPAAAKTRKLLKTKVSVEFKDTRTEDCMEELKDLVKGLKIILDTKGGVSKNKTLSFKGKDVTVEQVLDGLFKGTDLGYIVISKKGNAYDGLVEIRKSDERGYPKKK